MLTKHMSSLIPTVFVIFSSTSECAERPSRAKFNAHIGACNAHTALPRPWLLGARALRPLHVHINPHTCAQTQPQMHMSVLTCPRAPMHAHTPSHQTCLCTSGSHAHNRWETHVRSGLLWGAGQVNRCRETPPGPAGSPGSQNDPPPLPIPPPGPASKDMLSARPMSWSPWTQTEPMAASGAS